MGFGDTKTPKKCGGIGPMVWKVLGKEDGLLELPLGERKIGIGAGQMGKGSHKVQMGLAGQEEKKTRKIARSGAQTVHSSIQLGLHQSYGAGFGGGLGKFACLLDGRNRDREAMLKGKGVFRRQSRSKQ